MIFLNILNRIFGPKKPLSRQDIDALKSGQSTTHEIDSKLANSEFDRNALEGWNNTSRKTSKEMSNLDQKMDQFVHNGNTKGGNSKGMTLSFTLFSSAMIAIIAFTYQGNKAVENKPVETQIVANESTQENNKSSTIDQLSPIQLEKQITSKELMVNQEKSDNSKQSNISVDQDLEQDVIEKEQNELTDDHQLKLPIQSSGKIPNASPSYLVHKSAKEVYIAGLKNVDYRAYRNRPMTKKPDLNIGVPASKSSKDEEDKFTSAKSHEITYINYLTTASNYFKNRLYKMALKHYLTIIETYPDDVNANFYGGLCYFNLGEFDQALKLLKQSYSLQYGNFKQEAEWFSARAYLEQNKVSTAKRLLIKIKKQEGFYSKQAEELLKEI